MSQESVDRDRRARKFASRHASETHYAVTAGPALLGFSGLLDGGLDHARFSPHIAGGPSRIGEQAAASLPPSPAFPVRRYAAAMVPMPRPFGEGRTVRRGMFFRAVRPAPVSRRRYAILRCPGGQRLRRMSSVTIDDMGSAGGSTGSICQGRFTSLWALEAAIA